MSSPSPKSLEAAGYVVEAVGELADARGTSAEKITDFICKKYNFSEYEMKRYVTKALVRGIQFGAFTKSRGLYKVGEVIDYAKSHRRRRKSKGGKGKKRRRRR